MTTNRTAPARPLPRRPRALRAAAERLEDRLVLSTIRFPTDALGAPGGTVTLPLNVDASDGIEVVDVAVSYDTTRLDVASASDVKVGSVTGDFQFLAPANISPTGVIRASLSRTAGPISGRGAGSLLQVVFHVKADAPTGGGVVNLRASYQGTVTALNEGGIALNPAPSDTAGDALDGLITVGGRAASVTVASTASPSTYGQSLTFSATVSASSGTGTPGGSVQFQVDGKNLGTPVNLSGGSATSAAVATLTAGSHAVTAVYSGDAVFGAATGSGTQVVNQAVLTVKADDQSKLYGDAVPALTSTVTGFVLGETAATSGVTGAPSLSTAATASSPAGSYAITAAQGTLAASNYTFAFAGGTMTVGKAHLTVRADDKVKLYGDSVPVLTATVSGFVNGDTAAVLTGSPALSTSATAASPVGNYPITAAQGTLAAANYDFAFAGGTLAVGKAHLSVKADDKAKLYGDAVPSLTATVSGFVNGDTAAVLSGSPALATGATAASPVGAYTITAAQGTLAATNYDFAFANGTLTVGKAHLTVKADDRTKTYGDAVPLLTYSVTGFVNGETAAVVSGAPTLATPATAASPVGAYAITAAQGTLAATNYDFAFTGGTLTVGKARLTVTADDKGKLYGDSVPALTATVTGFVNGDTAAVVSGAPALSTAATAASSVGSYAITAAQGTLAAANYDFAFVGGTLTVSKAHLTIRADDKAKLYGDAVPALTFTATGFVNGDTAAALSGAPALATTATAASPAGSYAITAAQGTLAAANYDFAFVGGTLTVGKAHLTVKADDKVKLYGDTIPSLTATVTGFVNGDTAAVLAGAPALATSATAASPVGAYAITAAQGTLSATNYDFNFGGGTLTVGKAHLAVKADDKAKLYGDAVPTLTATVTGFVNGDTAAVLSGSPALATAATAASPVGSYAITAAQGTLAASNYDFAFAGGNLTVGKARLAVKADDKVKTYGDAVPALSYSVSGFVNGDTAAVLSGAPALATAATSSSAVGNYPITASQGTLAASNYDFGFAGGTLTVGKARLTVRADDKVKTQGTANPPLTATFSGFVLGENLGSSGVSGAPALATTAVTSSPAGSYPITAGLGTLAAANYDFAFADGTLTVQAAGAVAVTVATTASPSSYGQSLTFTATVLPPDGGPAPTGSVQFRVDGKDLGSAVPLAGGAASSVAIATLTAGGHGVTAVYSGDATYATASGSLTQTVAKAHLTVRADDQSRTYGAANPAFTSTISGFVLGETPATSGVTGAPALATAATVSSPVGTYAITAAQGTLAAANYDFTFSPGTLTVGKARLSVKADDQAKLYGAPVPALTYTATGFVNGDTASVLSGTPSLATAATSASPVGTYAVTAGPGTLAAANYDFGFLGGTLTVGKAHLTVKADDKAKVYGDSLPALTSTVSGFVNGDTAAVVSGSPSLATAATASSPVGSYAITAGAGTLAATNYDFTFADGTLTVGKARLTVKADDKAKLYGEAVPALTATVTGFVNGDTASVLSGSAALATGATASSPVGSYAINAAPGTLAAANYDFGFAGGTLTVGKAHLSVRADDKEMAHFDPVPTLTYSLTGFVNGDTAAAVSGTPALATTATPSSPAGYYAVTAAQGTLAAVNYDFTFSPGTLTVRPRVMDVRAVYGSRSVSLIGLRRDLPFLNVRAFEVDFSDDVSVALADFRLTSRVPGNPGYAPSGVTYRNSGGVYAATWGLPTAPEVDRLMLALDAAAIKAGPGVALAPFAPLNFDVLAGDYNGDGVVNSLDMTGVSAQSRGAGDPALAVWADLDGNGVVDIDDYNAVRRRIGKKLV